MMGRHLRDTMVERIGAVAESLGQLNLTDDPYSRSWRKQAG